MNLDNFIEAVNDAAPKDPERRKALEVIYLEVRETAVHGIAEMQRQRDEALAQLHRRLVLEGELVKR